MPLPRDADTLRVPAFMRKRSLRASARKPLILTALDRKNAGLLPEALQKKKDAQTSIAGRRERPVRRAKTERKEPLRRGWPYIDMKKISRERTRYKKTAVEPVEEPEVEMELKPEPAPKPARKRKPKPAIFSMPFAEGGGWRVEEKQRKMKDDEPKYEIKTPRQKTIGTMTHYYDKIKVGVIKLTGAVSVGDCITYDTEDGPYEQVIESMELDREPIFKAGKGKDIGLKLKKNPRIGCKVFK